MALFFLEYDLRRGKPADYQKLFDELARFQAVRMLKSSWCFNRVNTTAENLRDYFRQFIDANDGLIVSQVADWASFNTESNPGKLRSMA